MQHLPAPASDLNGAKVDVNGGRDAYLLLLLGTLCPPISICPICLLQVSVPTARVAEADTSTSHLVWFFFKPGNYLKIEPPTPR